MVAQPDVYAHEQVQVPVPVEVGEAGAGGVAGGLDPRLFWRQLSEAAVTQVLEEHVLAPHQPDEQVRVSVSVHVAEVGAAALPGGGRLQIGGLGDLVELAPQVVKETQPVAADEQDVVEAVPVHVAEGQP